MTTTPDFCWKDIGDGRPVQVQRCHKCGVCPSNVDDCGHFGDSRCPFFGIDALATPPTKPTELTEPPTDEELLAMRSWSSHSHTFDSDLVDFARAVLERWGN